MMLRCDGEKSVSHMHTCCTQKKMVLQRGGEESVTSVMLHGARRILLDETAAPYHGGLRGHCHVENSIEDERHNV